MPKEITLYACDRCDEEFDSEKEARDCEREHGEHFLELLASVTPDDCDGFFEELSDAGDDIDLWSIIDLFPCPRCNEKHLGRKGAGPGVFIYCNACPGAVEVQEVERHFAELSGMDRRPVIDAIEQFLIDES